jgi:hypothetical protein
MTIGCKNKKGWESNMRTISKKIKVKKEEEPNNGARGIFYGKKKTS